MYHEVLRFNLPVGAHDMPSTVKLCPFGVLGTAVTEDLDRLHNGLEYLLAAYQLAMLIVDMAQSFPS